MNKFYHLQSYLDYFSKYKFIRFQVIIKCNEIIYGVYLTIQI